MIGQILSGREFVEIAKKIEGGGMDKESKHLTDVSSDQEPIGPLLNNLRHQTLFNK